MIKLNALAAYCRRMGIGLRAGVDVLKLLETESRTGDANHRRSMSLVREQVLKGATLENAMKEQQGYFPPLLVQMVGASELGGRMDSMFNYMADHYEQLKETRSFFHRAYHDAHDSVGRCGWYHRASNSDSRDSFTKLNV